MEGCYFFLNIICIMQNGKQMVQEGALTALASVADSSQVFLTLKSRLVD